MGILKNRSSFLVKTRYAQFSSDPFNATNTHTPVHNGLIADGNRTSVQAAPAKKNCPRVNMIVKHKRRFVARGVGSKRRTNRTFNFSSMTMNDKNAAGRAKCPLVLRRTSRIHKASCRALRKAAQAK